MSYLFVVRTEKIRGMRKSSKKGKFVICIIKGSKRGEWTYVNVKGIYVSQMSISTLKILSGGYCERKMMNRE